MLLKESDILHILQGAAFMAGGGGGSVADALLLLEAFKKKYPQKPIELELLSVQELEPAKKAGGIAVMGAPSGGANLDITPCILHAFDALKQKSKEEGYELAYTLPLELGGFNTFVPILVSLYEGLPMVDADCCGRAVPGLETTLSHLHQLPTGPIVMADVENNCVTIASADAYDADKIEELALPIVECFSQNAGIAGWRYDATEIQQALPLYTISKCKQIGEGKGIEDSIQVAENCRILNFSTEQKGGWDIGSIQVEDADKKHYKITFSNENLLLEKMEDGRVLASAPDIITLYDHKRKMALTNEDMMLLQHSDQQNTCVFSILIIKPSAYWYHPNAQASWKRYFKLIGYQGTPISIFD